MLYIAYTELKVRIMGTRSLCCLI